VTIIECRPFVKRQSLSLAALSPALAPGGARAYYACPERRPAPGLS
jgi:hypothetical protein